MADTKIVAGNGATSQGGSADQTTIVGAGLAGDEFRAGVLEFPLGDMLLPGSTPVGTPVRIDSGYPDAPSLRYGTSNALGDAVINGLRAPNRGGKFVIQWLGLLTLTTDEWDAVVSGGSGGLVEGKAYYLSATNGKILQGLPASGQIASLVGYALSGTTMQLQLSCTGRAVP